MGEEQMSTQSELSRVRALVEAWLHNAGMHPDQHRLQAEYHNDPAEAEPRAEGWRLQRGSATVFITAQADEDDASQAYLHVYAPILREPEENREAFYRGLLRLNFDSLTACAFALDDSGAIVLTADRATEDLSLAELDEIISYISSLAVY